MFKIIMNFSNNVLASEISNLLEVPFWEVESVVNHHVPENMRGVWNSAYNGTSIVVRIFADLGYPVIVRNTGDGQVVSVEYDYTT